LKKILATPVRVYNSGATGINVGGIIWQNEVRKLLLYWPKVVIPNVVDSIGHNNFSSLDPSALSYLENEGKIENILLETRRDDSNVAAGIAERTREYLSHIESSDTSFAIFQSDSEPDSQADYIRNLIGTDITRVASAVSVQVSLMQMLPMVPHSATLQDIIDFKRKRADEFSNFRDMLDRLSHIFSKHGDLEEGARLAAKEAQSALVDLDRLTLERWPDRFLCGITAILGNFSKNMVVGGAVGTFVNEPLTGVFVGAATSAFLTKVDTPLFGARFDGKTKPFAYCLHARNL